MFFYVNNDLFSICAKSVINESADTMTIVEDCYDPIHRAYRSVKQETVDTNVQLALRITIKAINYFVCLEVMSPTLAVYAIMPMLNDICDRPLPSIYQRAIAVKKSVQAFT